MKLENGKLTLEVVPCVRCDGTGQRQQPIFCPNNGKPNKRTACPHCKKQSGTRNHDFLGYTPVKCEYCDNGQYQETLSDYFPSAIWPTLNFKVYRNYEPNKLEALFGFGAIYSSTDYGAAHKMSDEAVINKVKEPHSCQAGQIADKEGKLCDHIGIFVGADGYSVKAVFNK